MRDSRLGIDPGHFQYQSHKEDHAARVREFADELCIAMLRISDRYGLSLVQREEHWSWF